MKVISVLGRKGGQGKTLVSHFLSLGLGHLGYDVIMLQTDVRAEKPREYVQNRPYWLVGINGDPSKDEALMRDVYQRTSRIPNSVLVVDGGANRRNLDFFIAETAHIVIIPVGYSPEEIAVAEVDYRELRTHLDAKGAATEVYFMLNRWPGDTRKYETIMRRKWVADFVESSESRRFPIVLPDLTSLIDLASEESPYPLQYSHLKRASEIGAVMAAKLGLDAPPAREEEAEAGPVPLMAAE